MSNGCLSPIFKNCNDFFSFKILGNEGDSYFSTAFALKTPLFELDKDRKASYFKKWNSWRVLEVIFYLFLPQVGQHLGL